MRKHFAAVYEWKTEIKITVVLEHKIHINDKGKFD